ncbi:S1C family serine protease [Streptosporangium amethystogenes]|uniref:S1C family serine protease n=1 Tax=Streptosporangium amethystogenes TaxID=2002 RepID=UPI001FE091E7|nr:trypsin-like peptidase domain-containing protein [Streptosporangium amethystogenes]
MGEDMDPNRNEQQDTPAEATPGNDGWTQFGKLPPRAGAYRAGEETGPQPTLIHPVPERLAAEAPEKAGGPAVVPAQRGRLTAGQKIGAGLALAAMAIGGGVAGAFVATSLNGSATVVSSSGPVVSPVGNVTTVADIAQVVQPSVVSIEIRTAAGGGEGSGVVLSADGLILTNNHVVSAGGQAGPDSQVTVKFSDGKTATAKVVGTDPATDLAVIKAEGVSDLTKASIGDSDRLKVGDSVLAIGSPLGLSGSVTAGIVSALNRTLTVGGEQGQQQLPPGWGRSQESGQSPTTIGGAIQTDAAINPGNSGGALVNAAGQVVGINTAIATNGGEGSIGVGFAIPINTASHVAEQLIKSGKVSHALLGVSVTDATGDAGGALVGQVTEGSPAAKAGIRQGDLITKINDTPVDGAATVVGAVRGFKPGQQVTVAYVRDGQPQTVTVTLTEKTGE